MIQNKMGMIKVALIKAKSYSYRRDYREDITTIAKWIKGGVLQWAKNIEVELILRRKITIFQQRRLLQNMKLMEKNILRVIEKINNNSKKRRKLKLSSSYLKRKRLILIQPSGCN